MYPLENITTRPSVKNAGEMSTAPFVSTTNTPLGTITTSTGI